MPPDDLDDLLADVPAAPTRRSPRNRVHSIAARAGLSPDLADDYLKLTRIESGHNINVRNSSKGAQGFGQVMPDAPGGTTRTVGGRRYNLRDPDQNIEAGLRYFAAGGSDPVARRLHYFGGPRARQRYERTGRIPNISDGNMTAAQYVKATGAQQPARRQDDLDDLLADVPAAKSATTPADDLDTLLANVPAAPATGRFAGMARATTEAKRRPRQQPMRQPLPSLSESATAGVGLLRRNQGVGDLRRLDDPEAARIIRHQRQVAREPERLANARLLDPKLNDAEEAARRASEERVAEGEQAKHDAEYQRHKPEIDRLAVEYRRAIRSQTAATAVQAGGIGSLLYPKWGNEVVAKGIAPLVEKLAGIGNIAAMGGSPGAQAGVDKLRIHAQALQQAAMEEGANRSEASKFVQDIAGGFIGTAPELAAMSVGVPAPLAFAAGEATHAYGRGEPVAPALAHGALTGAAFEIPVGGQGLRRVAKKAAAVGGATGAVELATGRTPREAAVTAATNAAMIGVPAMIQARRPASGVGITESLRIGQRIREMNRNAQTQTQPDVTAQSEAVEPATAIAGRPANAINPPFVGRRAPADPRPTEAAVVQELGVQRPQAWQHRDFGKVVESPDQSGVGRGRVRVVDETGAEHVIKRAKLTGAGNQIAIPVRKGAANEAISTSLSSVTEAIPESAAGVESKLSEPEIVRQAREKIAAQQKQKGELNVSQIEQPSGEVPPVRERVQPRIMESQPSEQIRAPQDRPLDTPLRDTRTEGTAARLESQEIDKAWERYQTQSSDTSLGAQRVRGVEIRKVSNADMSETRGKLREGEAVHGWTHSGKEPIVFLRGNLTREQFEHALKHEFDHISNKDFRTFDEEYPNRTAQPAEPARRNPPEPLPREAVAVEPQPLPSVREGEKVSTEQERIAAGTKRVGDSYVPPPESPTAATPDAFVDAMPPMQRARAKSALERQVRTRKGIVTRAELVEQAIADGAKMESKEVVDEVARRKLQAEYDRTKGTYPFGNQNHPETIRFNEVKRQLAKGGPKITTRRLVAPDGSFRDEQTLSKTAMDYAEHLLSQPFLQGEANTPTPQVESQRQPPSTAVESAATMKPESTTTPAAERQPWEMSRDEYKEYVSREERNRVGATAARRSSSLEKQGKRTEWDAMVDNWRRGEVETALREGRNVPPEVLADYPELQQQTPPPAAGVGGGEGGRERVFYRGTVPGETQRIDEPFEAARGRTFVAKTEKGARNYGEAVEQITANPDAKILDQADADFWKLIRRRRPPNGYIGSTLRRGETLIDAVNDTIRKAEAQGYDAVSFGDADIGTVILNEKVFKRNAALPPQPETKPAAGVLPSGWPDVKRGDTVYVDGKAVEVTGVGNHGEVLSAEGNIAGRYSKTPPRGDGSDSGSVPRLPPLKDNYRKHLKEYADTFYHETNADKALDLLPTSRRTTDVGDVYLSNTPDLALGQRGNRGILLEFEPRDLEGQVNRSKPTWEHSYSQGQAEFIGRYNKQQQYQDALTAVTVRPDVKMSRLEKIQVDRALADMEQSGWSKTQNPDGSVTYRKGSKEAASPPTEPPTQPPPPSSTAAKREAAERSLPKTLEAANLPGGTERFYDVKSNIESEAKARQVIKERGVDGASNWVQAGEKTSVEQSATAVELIKGLAREAEAETNVEIKAAKLQQAAELSSTMSVRSTEAGQAIQYFATLAKESPAGAVYYAERAARKRNPDTGLSKEQRTEIFDLATRLKSTETELDAVKGQLEKALAARPKRQQSQVTTRIREWADQAEKDARERLAARTGVGQSPERGASTIPLDIADYSIIGAAKLARGTVEFAEWSKQMVGEFGDEVKPYLRRIRSESQRLLDEQTRAARAGKVLDEIARVGSELRAESRVIEAAQEIAKGASRTDIYRKVKADHNLSHDAADQLVGRAQKLYADANKGLRDAQRERAALKREPDATPERIKEIEAERDRLMAQRGKERRELAAFQRRLEQGGPGLWSRANNAFRGIIVSAVQTASRNLATQELRANVESLTDAFELAIVRGRQKAGIGTREGDIDPKTNFLDTLKSSAYLFQRNKRIVNGILDEFPVEHEQMFRRFSSDVELAPRNKAAAGADKAMGYVERGVEVVNTFNRFQEFLGRRAVFRGVLEARLRARGIDLTKEVKAGRQGAIPREDIQAAVDAALRVTFAESPARGSKSESFVHFTSSLPAPINPLTFSRFLWNGAKFTLEYQPTTVLRGLYRDVRGRSGASRDYAKAAVGTVMLTTAVQLYDTMHKDGSEWYLMTNPATGNEFDIRPYQPFASYIFVAHWLRAKQKGEQVSYEPSRMGRAGVYVEGLTGFQARPNPAWEGAKSVASENWDGVVNQIKRVAGETVAATLTPLKTPKQIIAQFDEQEATLRNTRKRPFLDPIVNAVPLAGKSLDPILRKDRPMVQRNPLLQLLGIREIDADTKYTRAENLMRSIIQSRYGDEERTQVEIDRDRQKAELRSRSRRGEDVTKELDALNLPPKQRKVIEDAKGLTQPQEWFKKLDVKEAIRVYKVMSRGEREAVRDIFAAKADRAMANLSDEDKAEVQPDLAALGFVKVEGRKPKDRTERRDRRERQQPSYYQYQGAP